MTSGNLFCLHFGFVLFLISDDVFFRIKVLSGDTFHNLWMLLSSILRAGVSLTFLYTDREQTFLPAQYNPGQRFTSKHLKWWEVCHSAHCLPGAPARQGKICGGVATVYNRLVTVGRPLLAQHWAQAQHHQEEEGFEHHLYDVWTIGDLKTSNIIKVRLIKTNGDILEKN